MTKPLSAEQAPTPDTVQLLSELIAGIERWAKDEDGIPDYLVRSYKALKQRALSPAADAERLDAERSNAMWTPKEAAKLLANRVMQPHYVEWVIRKCIAHALAAAPARGGEGKDGARYRHIKADTSLAWICLMRREPDEWDAEIDAAMSREAKG